MTTHRQCLFTLLCFVLSISALLAEPPKAQTLPQRVADLRQAVAAEYPHLDKLYKHFHSNPELSLQEAKTSARLASELREAGFSVTEKVGGYGVVAVLENGKGSTILVRADMDGLPIEEKTNLPYASKVKVRDAKGNIVGVMHACGHDVNLTCLVGLARVLAKRKDQWRGTLVLIGQPAEEIGAGAQAMLRAGLFEKFPRPDYCFALHCDARYPHGHVNYREGMMQSNVDSVDILVRGKGGHGAAPHTTVDPIVLAARIVLDLQTIRSREIDPLQPAVVTVGSIHGGTKHNIIPAEVKMELTIRSTSDAVRNHILESIERKVNAVAASARAPKPKVIVNPGGWYTPSLFNDIALSRSTVELFQRALGKDRVHRRPMSMGGEDFSRYLRAGVPGFYYFLGSADPKRVAAAKSGGKTLTRTHTPFYDPVPEPTIKTGVLMMSLAVLNQFAK